MHLIKDALVKIPELLISFLLEPQQLFPKYGKAWRWRWEGGSGATSHESPECETPRTESALRIAPYGHMAIKW